MKCSVISLLALAFASSSLGQQPASAPQSASAQQPVSTQQSTDLNPIGGAAAATVDGPNLPSERLGADDLIAVSVYDAPELTRTVRIDFEGKIRLPMVRQHIQAAGLVPAELEKAIAAALIEEQVMVDPIVSVTVTEYRSRPITVLGAVKTPLTFQAAGTVTLFEAITRAGGITENAGLDILVSHPSLTPNGTSVFLTDRIPVHSLLDISSPASNMKLEGGETIRIPPAGQIFVAGNVKHPGPFSITNGSESSVLRALAMAGGLDSFSSHTAYIYRTDDTSGQKSQIPINITKIIARKSPDVPLYGDDMLYVQNVTGERVSAKALQIAVGVGLGIAGVLIYILQ